MTRVSLTAGLTLPRYIPFSNTLHFHVFCSCLICVQSVRISFYKHMKATHTKKKKNTTSQTYIVLWVLLFKAISSSKYVLSDSAMYTVNFFLKLPVYNNSTYMRIAVCFVQVFELLSAI